MIVFLAGSAGAAEPSAPRGTFDVPRPAVPMRDVVRAEPSAHSARIAAASSTGRYSIGDGSDSMVTVVITDACQQYCEAADPGAIASFIGTLLHGSEVNVLTVQLDTPRQIEYDCGIGAAACYFTGRDRIILSGDESFASDGASRDFVLAHEYGHHVAQHRRAPAPFGPAVDWGTTHWATYKNVCQGQRSRRLFPGNEGFHYFEDPGEAYAESFAYIRFPDAPQGWAWVDSLKPNPQPSPLFAATFCSLGVGAAIFPSRGASPGAVGARRASASAPRSMVASPFRCAALAPALSN